VEVVGGVEGLVAGGFERRDLRIEFAGRDLVGGGGGVAELTGGEVSIYGAGGRAEGSAEDGAVVVEVAGTGGGVEDGAGLVVGVFLEEGGGLLVFGEDAKGGGVAGVASSWKPRVEAGEGCGDALLDSGGSVGIGSGEGGEAFAEAGGVFVGDGEDSDAALGAAGPANEVRAAAESGGGERGGDDLDQFLRHRLSDFLPLSGGYPPPGYIHRFVHDK
jgi:hypothetical protein